MGDHPQSIHGANYMNDGFKLGMLALATALALPTGGANASVATYTYYSNAVNYCQAFTPGPANTIRNRVVGSENVGTAPMNLACNFGSIYNGANGVTPPSAITIYFSNTSAVAITIKCSLMTGYMGSYSAYLSSKSVEVPAHSTDADYSVSWNASDNPDQPATSLGDYLLGINCIMPPGAVANDTYVDQRMDNGVGT
jgi:hypothetical protein